MTIFFTIATVVVRTICIGIFAICVVVSAMFIEELEEEKTNKEK